MPLIKSDDASGSAAKVDLNLQSGTDDMIVAPMQASAVSASPEVSSNAENNVSIPSESRQTSEGQGSSAPNVVTSSQLPPAFRGILPPPQIPTIPPPPQVQPTIPPSPPIHSFPPVPPPFQPYARIFRPGSRPGSRYGVSASASATPPSTSIYGSTPVPTPADGNPTGPASSPVASQASGYRHLTNQQPFHWPATHRQRKLRSSASPYSRASDPTTYMSQGPHSRFQYSSPALSTGSPASDLTAYKPRLAGTPLEISGSPGRKRADAFVAHDPFRPGTSSSQTVAGLISNDTTFDDIPTASSPRSPFPSIITQLLVCTYVTTLICNLMDRLLHHKQHHYLPMNVLCSRSHLNIKQPSRGKFRCIRHLLLVIFH